MDVVDGSGTVAGCRVSSVGSGQVELLVVELTVVPEPDPRITLVQALAKGGRDELAVETATEVGVDAVVPWQADRSVVVWSGPRGQRARDRWTAISRAATKQSRRPRIPPVRDPVDSRGLVGLATAATATLVLHEAATEPLTRRCCRPGGSCWWWLAPREV